MDRRDEGEVREFRTKVKILDVLRTESRTMGPALTRASASQLERSCERIS